MVLVTTTPSGASKDVVTQSLKGQSSTVLNGISYPKSWSNSEYTATEEYNVHVLQDLGISVNAGGLEILNAIENGEGNELGGGTSGGDFNNPLNITGNAADYTGASYIPGADFKGGVNRDGVLSFATAQEGESAEASFLAGGYPNLVGALSNPSDTTLTAANSELYPGWKLNAATIENRIANFNNVGGITVGPNAGATPNDSYSNAANSGGISINTGEIGQYIGFFVLGLVILIIGGFALLGGNLKKIPKAV
ncbi:MAG: hypothetical protein ACRDFB_06415 [Rhabdochlamydiaceae bacterium]